MEVQLPLVCRLTPEQQLVAEALLEVYTQSGRWPVFDYMADLFGPGAEGTITSFPRVGSYAAVIADTSGGLIQLDARVRLSVAGIACTRTGASLAKGFLTVLADVVNKVRDAPRDPHQVVKIQYKDEDLSTALATAGLADGNQFETAIAGILRSEPGITNGWGGDNGSWMTTVDRGALHYADVQDIFDYVDRVEQIFRQPQFAQSPTLRTDAVHAIDHLDVVWALLTGRRLFRIPSAGTIERITKVAVDSHQVDTWLAAVADLLNGMRPSGVGERSSLQSWRDELRKRLPEHEVAAAHDYVITLQHLIAVRSGGQHAAVAGRRARGLNALGVSYPVQDWALAWRTMNDRFVGALDGLGETLQRAAFNDPAAG